MVVSRWDSRVTPTDCPTTFCYKAWRKPGLAGQTLPKSCLWLETAPLLLLIPAPLPHQHWHEQRHVWRLNQSLLGLTAKSRQESGYYTNEPFLHGSVNPECPGATGSCGTLACLWDPHREDRADKCSCIVSFVVLGLLKGSLWPLFAPAAGRGEAEYWRGGSVCFCCLCLTGCRGEWWVSGPFWLTPVLGVERWGQRVASRGVPKHACLPLVEVLISEQGWRVSGCLAMVKLLTTKPKGSWEVKGQPQGPSPYCSWMNTPVGREALCALRAIEVSFLYNLTIQRSHPWSLMKAMRRASPGEVVSLSR